MRQVCRENRNTHFTLNKFFSKNRAVYDIIRKNMVEPDRPQMTNIIGRMSFACWITKARDTHTIRNNYCFSTATMVTRRRPIITLYILCLSCYVLGGYEHLHQQQHHHDHHDHRGHHHHHQNNNNEDNDNVDNNNW